MPSVQFDLEQQILLTWSVVEDIKLARVLLEDSNGTDKAENLLLGMEVKYQHMFEELFELFEELLKEKSKLS